MNRVRASDFGEIWYSNAFRRSGPFRMLKCVILKNQDGGGRHLEKAKTDISPAWF